MAAAAGRALVYGGRGALGATVVKQFKSRQWWVCSVDLFANEEADANVVLSPTDSWTGQETEVEEKVGDAVNGDKFDAIVCVAGGWAGGSAASKDLVSSADLMVKQSVWTSVISARLANLHLKSNGLLVLTGAKAGLSGTPGMIGYGLAKAAVHQLVHSLLAPDSGLPEGTSVVGILPVTLDTPGNRKGMPNADFNQWTPLAFIAEKVLEWSEGKGRPSGLLTCVTTDGDTSLSPVVQD